MDNNVKLYNTKDGSNTLYHLKLNEIYHSRNGAITESKHVFIKHGLQYLFEQNLTKINIFELGFGTGFNAILSYHFAEKNNINLYYESIDTLPLFWNTVEKLDYHNIERTINESIYKKLINEKWGFLINISDKCNFFKEKIDISVKMFSNKFDLVYFDAFAPEIQPNLWSESVFEKLYNSLNINGILVTYCAKGIVKRALKSVGFEVENLPGPPGKREMTRAKRTQ